MGLLVLKASWACAQVAPMVDLGQPVVFRWEHHNIHLEEQEEMVGKRWAWASIPTLSTKPQTPSPNKQKVMGRWKFDEFDGKPCGMAALVGTVSSAACQWAVTAGDDYRLQMERRCVTSQPFLAVFVAQTVTILSPQNMHAIRHTCK